MSLGPLDLWMQWWLGDVRNDVPPLKILQGRDVYHLDFIMAEEGRGTRKARKILCDIRFLMVYLENKVRATGKWVETHTVSSVLAMYYEVVETLVVNDGNNQHHSCYTPPSSVKMADIGVDPSQARKAFIHGHARRIVYDFLPLLKSKCRYFSTIFNLTSHSASAIHISVCR